MRPDPAIRKTFFFIDDDPFFNMFHRHIIALSGFAKQVHTFLNGRTAIDKLKHLAVSNPDELPEIIFLDINMPELDGWGFLEEYEKLPPAVLEKCRVIILSSSIDPNDIEKSYTYSSVDNFISKPLTEVELMSALSVQKSAPGV